MSANTFPAQIEPFKWAEHDRKECSEFSHFEPRIKKWSEEIIKQIVAA
jgi:hypothetical protein